MKNEFSFIDMVDLFHGIKQFYSMKKSRKSKLDEHIPWIFRKLDEGWSYRRIQRALLHEKKVEIKAASTIQRKVKAFLDEL